MLKVALFLQCLTLGAGNQPARVLRTRTLLEDVEAKLGGGVANSSAFGARMGWKRQRVEESVPSKWGVERGWRGGGCKFFRISGAYGLETPNSGRIGALQVVEEGVERGGRMGCKFFRISGAYGLETPNSGRIGALLGGRRGG